MRLRAVCFVLLAACGGNLPQEAPAPQIVYGSRVQVMPLSSGAIAESVPTGAQLAYYGGRVISNVQVVQVLWGGGSYLPGIAGPDMGNFYRQVTSSPYFDWLSEYATPAWGTGQTIGRGSFLRQVQITPANTSLVIDDTQIQTELAAQILAGKLPAPTADAAGNVNTYYAIFFPHGMTVTEAGAASCQAFCAFHGTLSLNGRSVYYGVHPDMQSGSGCELACGSAATAFGNATSVASHELVEAVTDAEIGLATTYAPPLAWYDQRYGEIGDICNAQQGTITGTDGVTYVVQKEFSNAAGACVVTSGIVSALANGGFESGLGGWTTSGAVSVVTAGCHGGSSCAMAGSVTPTAGDSTLAATFTAPEAATGISFWYRETCPDTVTYDWATAVLKDATDGTAVTILPRACNTTGWRQVSANVVAGHSYTLLLTSHDDNFGADPTYTLFDDLTLTTTPVSGGVANGGFESGLDGWTTSGTASTATLGCHGGAACAQLGSASPTSGDSTAAQSFTVPAGKTQLSFWMRVSCPDSVAYDWATVSLRNNTAATTAVLVPKTCSNNGAWVNVTAPVTAGTSYMLVLTNHDDNWSGDATSTLFDDVVLN